MAISYPEQATQRGQTPDSGPLAEITLGMTRSMATALDDLSEQRRAPIDEVLGQGVALLMVAIEAQRRGQRLCLADDLRVVGEIVDFGVAGERAGIV